MCLHMLRLWGGLCSCRFLVHIISEIFLKSVILFWWKLPLSFVLIAFIIISFLLIAIYYLLYRTGSYDTDDKKEDDSDSDEDSESDMEVDDQKPVAESLPVVKKTPQKKDDLKDDDLDFLLSKPLDWIKWCGDLKLQ